MRAIVGALLVVIALALGYFLYARMTARREVEHAPGQPAGALVVPTADGARLVLIDRVGKSARGASYRFTAIDPETGTSVGSRTIDEPARCWPASTGRMWCADPDGRVHLVSVPSFDAVTASSADEQSRTWLGSASPGCTFADSVPIGGAHLTFGTGTRRPLVKHVEHDEGKEPVSYSLPGVPDFLSPSFLRVEDPALLLVQHDAALDRPGALQLSRVDADLHLQWTADLEGRCESAHVVGARIILTSDDSAHRALALQLATGAPAWRYRP